MKAGKNNTPMILHSFIFYNLEFRGRNLWSDYGAGM